ncbi:MAG: flagellar basal body rod protein FlgB [Zoogloeaceae bacterium]|jgi:flagellar basal-body rod protein FlgB|nr:flagellar basal body rod protein FlgB [Zoogloeaceae bacterium]
MIGNLKAYLAPYAQGLDLRAYRQQVLASNIANADTPYYKARDFDFKAAYATAMGQREESGHLALVRTNPGHLPMTAGGALDAVNLQYRTEHQSAVDGNTVDMDVERAQIADNALQYQILSQFMTNKLQGLRSAIASNQGG